MTQASRPSDSVLARFLSSECSPGEVVVVERWLAENTTNAQELQRLAAAWARPLAAAEAGRKPDVDVIWRGVRERIEAPVVPPVQVVRPRAPRPTPAFALGDPSRWFTVTRTAAAIALIAGGGLGLRVLIEKRTVTAEPIHSVISTARGQRLTVRLADGTLVALAPGSTMRTPSTYGVRDRRVQLDGEAVFSVTHDATRPFTVQTRLAVARDLGTRFVVRAYAEDPQTDVVVAEGLVAVGRSGSVDGRLSVDSLVVSPGNQVRVNSAGQLSLTRDVPLDRYFGWADGELVFRRTPLREVIAQLERWYNIEIRLASPEVGEQVVTATFSEHEPAQQVLQVVATALELAVIEHGSRSYALRAKK